MPLGIACSKYQTRPWQMRDATAQQEDPMELQAPELFRQQAFIDGIWCEADQGRRTDIFNPATGDKLGSVPDMGAEETRRAIEAAQAAQPAWRKQIGRASCRERG